MRKGHPGSNQGEFQAIVARAKEHDRIVQNVSGELISAFHKSPIQVRPGDIITMMFRKVSKGWRKSKWTGEWSDMGYIYNNNINAGWEI